MAEVIPASGDDWREIEMSASLPDGHIERALLEILQRLVPVENRVVPVEAQAATPNTQMAADAALPEYERARDAARVAAAPPVAAPCGGMTHAKMAEVMKEARAEVERQQEGARQEESND